MPRSSAARDESALGSAADIIEANAVVTDRGVYGLVWLDEQLRALSRFGALVDFIPVGERVTDSVIALLGFDDQILALRRRPQGSVEIPDISIDFADTTSPRISLHLYWVPRRKRFLLFVARPTNRTDMQLELERQVRMRAIAEAEVVEKSTAILKANQELAAANRDLEEFAYVISHDLRAPLRGLRYAANDIERALAMGNSSAARSRLTEVERQLRRMTSMLTGLLEYARVGRKAEVIESVDMRALVDEIVASLAPGSGFRIEVSGRWPRLDTLAAPLDLVLRNLIDNALKHHDRDEGVVRIEAHQAGPMLVIEVADDGPGIATAWQSAVFLPFRKGSDTERDVDAESPGIGLALVRKTLERLGGRIDVASDPERRRGTTFTVHWPRQIRS